MTDAIDIILGDFALGLATAQPGGWVVSCLSWRKQVIALQESTGFPIGWEVNIDGVRYTPHHPAVKALPLDLTACAAGRLTLGHTLPGGACVRQHLAVHGATLEMTWEFVAGSRTQILERLNFAQLRLAPAFIAGLELRHFYTNLPAPTLDARLDLHDPAIVLYRPTEGWGLAVVNHAPGQTHAFTVGACLSAGYSTGAAPFRRELQARETFVSAPAAFVAFKGRATTALHAYARHMRAGRQLPQPLTYCSWEPFGRDIDEPRITAQLAHAADLGFEVFVIDDGWQRHAGDWEVDPTKFPRGLEPLREAAERVGLRLGLWLALSTVHVNSKAYAAHRNDLLLDAEGRPRRTDAIEGHLDLACLASPYFEHILARVRHWVSTLNLRYLKLDLPATFDVYQQPALHCHAPGHRHAPGRDYTLRAYEAVQSLARTLRTEFPELIVDLTFELWGGWHSVDHALASCADTIWLSNLPDVPGDGRDGPVEARHLVASRAAILPPGHLVVGNLRCNGPRPLESAASAFGSFPMLLGDLSSLEPQVRDELRALFSWFRNERARTDLNAHAATVLERGASAPEFARWSGYLRCDEVGNGLLGVFRNQSPMARAVLTVALPQTALNGDTLFELRSPDAATTLHLSARELTDGFELSLPQPHGFALFSLSPRPASATTEALRA